MKPGSHLMVGIYRKRWHFCTQWLIPQSVVLLASFPSHSPLSGFWSLAFCILKTVLIPDPKPAPAWVTWGGVFPTCVPGWGLRSSSIHHRVRSLCYCLFKPAGRRMAISVPFRHCLSVLLPGLLLLGVSCQSQLLRLVTRLVERSMRFGGWANLKIECSCVINSP